MNVRLLQIEQVLLAFQQRTRLRQPATQSHAMRWKSPASTYQAVTRIARNGTVWHVACNAVP
jgi:hypothetical protein